MELSETVEEAVTAICLVRSDRSSFGLRKKSRQRFALKKVPNQRFVYNPENQPELRFCLEKASLGADLVAAMLFDLSPLYMQSSSGTPTHHSEDQEN